MFTGYKLTKESRNKLIEQFPPEFDDLICHHITEKYGVEKTDPAPEQPKKFEVYAHIKADGVEGFLVSVDEQKDRADGSKYHITHSIDRKNGKSPVDTNKYVNDESVIFEITPFEIDATSMNFYKDIL